MRTTLDLDDGLVEALTARHPGLSRTEAIERAIKAYLEGDAVERLLSLAGSFEIEDVSAGLRAVDRP
jgi:Bacterial antitoxin of type II TA system, VapB